MREPDYRGLAALVLAVSIALTFVIGMVALAVWGKSLGESGAEALIALGGAVVGLLAGFITGRASNHLPPPERPPDKEPKP